MATTLGQDASSSHHIFGNRGLAYLDAELEQLAMDPGRSSERVGGCSSVESDREARSTDGRLI
jgi:hypothetical protein